MNSTEKCYIELPKRKTIKLFIMRDRGKSFMQRALIIIASKSASKYLKQLASTLKLLHGSQT